jgi:hypothetical protein
MGWVEIGGFEERRDTNHFIFKKVTVSSVLKTEFGVG